ncbi:unnamed protein product [Fusarium equiseti]|uniref:BTB domain-containing protein n=1 Tax=Fusarium equiseti TaxID=61235 RepID=A0A8J2NHS9_FUSEQ|nr:unnamed protein product [Fusarium equiseti]
MAVHQQTLGTWNRGAREYPGHKVVETLDGKPYQQLFVDMTCLEEYRMFSVEEHRLEDYKQTGTGTVAELSLQKSSNGTSAEVLKGGRLASLRGKGIEVHVGSQPPSDENTWTLPVKLISRHSAYFKTACLWNATGTISLPEQDPITFSLFVEWMYYTAYDACALGPSPSIHARCWVLADYLLCNEFKTYAMSRLFKDHVNGTTVFGNAAVNYADVEYVCSFTAPDSKLREFYMDFAVDHFANAKMLRGTTAEWDAIFQNHPQARSRLLENMRSHLMAYTNGIEYYLEANEFKVDSYLRMNAGLVGLSIAENKTDIATAEHTSNNELSQSTEGFQSSSNAPAFVPNPPPKSHAEPWSVSERKRNQQ